LETKLGQLPQHEATGKIVHKYGEVTRVLYEFGAIGEALKKLELQGRPTNVIHRLENKTVG
jgi:hypothetical protein